MPPPYGVDRRYPPRIQLVVPSRRPAYPPQPQRSRYDNPSFDYHAPSSDVTPASSSTPAQYLVYGPDGSTYLQNSAQTHRHPESRHRNSSEPSPQPYSSIHTGYPPQPNFIARAPRRSGYGPDDRLEAEGYQRTPSRGSSRYYNDLTSDDNFSYQSPYQSINRPDGNPLESSQWEGRGPPMYVGPSLKIDAGCCAICNEKGRQFLRYKYSSKIRPYFVWYNRETRVFEAQHTRGSSEPSDD
ncbi:hypothetical protein FFLO_01036 [Filobasidium floriforme]|uniref:Uncharacterized protein n=1 Tax=Filobasidium floriforme TaxID=5210 RepID=A0A8K0JQG3_9TREE|nr:uncharacterized protein HD553DRAFT_325420 [Filobasidium floriforme]KAG7571072.1 hypothetical protein FFLO_01036 [Filobasidium floriforme]KAH8081373.1 hypothetical protein HD553DRAFT_325420 [Filobasidium floriforme]